MDYPVRFRLYPLTMWMARDVLGPHRLADRMEVRGRTSQAEGPGACQVGRG